jgi:hypothetical protein
VLAELDRAEKNGDVVRLYRTMQILDIDGQKVMDGSVIPLSERFNAEREDIRYSREFADAIDLLDQGKLPRDADTYIQVLDHTPNVYIERAKSKDRRIIMSWETAYLAKKKGGTQAGNYHNLGPKTMKQIPVKLADPEYIVLRPDGRINAILELKKKNRPVLISVEMEAYEHTKQENTDDDDIYNLIVTVMDASHNYLINSVFGKGKIVLNKKNEDPVHFISRLKLSQNATMPGNDLTEPSEEKDITSDKKVKSSGESYSREVDPTVLAELDRAEKNGDVIRLYRTMQILDIDGQKVMMSPMNARRGKGKDVKWDPPTRSPTTTTAT